MATASVDLPPRRGERVASLADRARDSGWPHRLASQISCWEATMAPERDALPVQAEVAVRPGVPLRRSTRHLLALSYGNLRWTLRQRLWMSGGPGEWLRVAAVDYLAGQLSVLSPFDVTPISADAVWEIVSRRLGDRVRTIQLPALSVTPYCQLHRAELADGTAVLVSVLRPGVEAAVRDDLRILATAAAMAELVAPKLRPARPSDLLATVARQALQQTDLRHAVLNTIELGLTVEELGVPGLRVARPIPGPLDPRIALYEDVPDAVPLADAADRVDLRAALPGLLAATVEGALARGVFHADLRPQHLLVQPDGSLLLAGCGALGRLSRPERRGSLDYLVALLSGDAPGRLDALTRLGATPSDVDRSALVTDLETAPALRPKRLLLGGDRELAAAARATAEIGMRHQVFPPAGVRGLLAAGLALRATAAAVAPGLTAAQTLLPMVTRLRPLADSLA